ncbi:1847_t:CDS:2, partial [Scutellospora calospora]
LLILKDKLEIIRIMQQIYFLAKHHYATHGLRDLKKLNTQQFNETKDKALFRPFVSLKKVQSIVDPLNTIYSEYSSYDNNVSSIQIDESNTIKQEKILVIVSKHLSDNYLD